MRSGSRKKNRKMAARIRNARPAAALKKAAVMTARAAAPLMKGQPEGSIRTRGTLHQVTSHKAQVTRHKGSAEARSHRVTRFSVAPSLDSRDKCDRTEPRSLRF